MNITFASITGILAWVGGNHVKYLGNDEKLPYVLKGNLYHYFSYTGKQYKLSMTSERDLGEHTWK